MREELQSLLKNKKDLRRAQTFFKDKLNETYPVLMNENWKATCKNIINEELDLLLSSCLRYKTTRIKIPIIRTEIDTGYRYYGTRELILTRNPGLKVPYGSASELIYSEIKNLKGRDIETNIGYRSESLCLVNLAILEKTPKTVNQEKLNQFYLFLEEWFRIIQEKAYTFFDETVYRYGSDSESAKNFNVVEGENGIFVPEQVDFRFRIKGNKSFNIMNASKLYIYSESDNQEDWNTSSLSTIQQDKILNNFDLYHQVLLRLNNEKKEIIKVSTDLLKRILEFNKPFKILTRLSKK